jgi:nucleoside-diphosphate-sugar epimerase
VKRVLVTGGAGFIGSHLVRRLADDGAEVVVLDNLSGGSAANLEGANCRLIEDDILNQPAVQLAAEGADLVFHLAAMVSVPQSIQDPVACYDTNLMGSLNVLRAANRAGVRRVVLSSSCAVYGEQVGSISESAPTSPMSPYAAAKWAMEVAGQIFNSAYELPTVSLRYFNVYGPRQSPQSEYSAAIPQFIQAMLGGQAPTIFGDGQQTRDFVFVDDVVQANLLAAESLGAPGGVFNIGGGQAVSVLELVDRLRSMIPGAPEARFAPRRVGDIRYSQADLGRASTALGYRPTVDLHTGLRATVAWFQDAGERVGP